MIECKTKNEQNKQLVELEAMEEKHRHKQKDNKLGQIHFHLFIIIHVIL